MQKSPAKTHKSGEFAGDAYNYQDFTVWLTKNVGLYDHHERKRKKLRFAAIPIQLFGHMVKRSRAVLLPRACSWMLI